MNHSLTSATEKRTDIITYVSPRESSTNNEELYPVENFGYNKNTDTYTCPAGYTLTTTGKWYRHSDSRKGRFSYRSKRYTASKCRECIERQHCTGGKHNGMAIDRSEYAEALKANTERVEQNPQYYRQRQQIIEHIFGTLKRVKGKENVLGEVGLMFIGYNLSRCVTILGAKNLIKLLRDRFLCYFVFVKKLILLQNGTLFFQKLEIEFL